MTEKSLINDYGEHRDVLDNLQMIRENIADACARCHRNPEEITLMAVTKTVAAERINPVLDAGIRCIGENRVQEFLEKRDALHLAGVQKHLIGHLQTNKVSRIVGQVDMIQSVDSIKVASAISEASLKIGCVTDILVEINIGNEASKSGIKVSETSRFLEQISAFHGVSVKGLMTIPPISHSEQEKRHFFSEMHKVFIDIRGKNIDNMNMSVLSMGMSDDYVEAILEGSTLVRIGSALFGKRVK